MGDPRDSHQPESLFRRIRPHRPAPSSHASTRRGAVSQSIRPLSPKRQARSPLVRREEYDHVRRREVTPVPARRGRRVRASPTPRWRPSSTKPATRWTPPGRRGSKLRGTNRSGSFHRDGDRGVRGGAGGRRPSLQRRGGSVGDERDSRRDSSQRPFECASPVLREPGDQRDGSRRRHGGACQRSVVHRHRYGE